MVWVNIIKVRGLGGVDLKDEISARRLCVYNKMYDVYYIYSGQLIREQLMTDGEYMVFAL